MQDFLIVVDMQNDFIDGALGSPEAQAIVSPLSERLSAFEGKVIFTRDTHLDNYLDTNEGKHLPVPHCIRDTHGWQITSALDASSAYAIIDKPTFGATALAHLLLEENRRQRIGKIIFTGVCTDICVISNVLLAKATLPEADICVESSLCAGVTPERHCNALAAMEACQITILP